MCQMANLTNATGDFTQMYLPNHQIRDSDEEDEESFSLPSFSYSVRQQLQAVNQDVRSQPLVKSGSLTSLKEIESQNAELRRENFDLKLRLYLREKEKNGVTQPEYESSVAQELSRKDNLIRSLQASIDQKEDQLRREREQQLSLMKVRDMELSRTKTERDHLKEQLHLLNHKKENMGQAISRQLQRIEKLLETTTMYVQEMQ